MGPGASDRNAATAATTPPTLHISGEVDLASRDRWLALARELIARPNTALVRIDLTGVTFIDSAGLGMLITAGNLADEHRVYLKVVNVPEIVQRLLTLTQVTLTGRRPLPL